MCGGGRGGVLSLDLDIALVILSNPLRRRHLFLHLLKKFFLNTDHGLGGALSREQNRQKP